MPVMGKQEALDYLQKIIGSFSLPPNVAQKVEQATTVLQLGLDKLISLSGETGRWGWGVGPKEFYKALRNKSVQVCVGHGVVCSGLLRGVSTYELFVEDAEGEVTLIAKGAIQWVKPAET